MSTATTPPPPPYVAQPPPSPPAPQRRRVWMAKRFVLGALGVVLLAAAATVTFALNEVGKIVDALGETRAAKIAPSLLAPTTRGAPETLLLVGNDQRPAPKNNPLYGAVPPHSNEMLLVHIDPSKPTIAMLSIPRELQVTFTTPQGQVVTNRINSAYTYGGIELMTKTIKRVLGVSVNHVFVVTFPKFKRAVNEMGCVYGTIDRRYYHVNEPGGEQYFEINLQPGYQRLCGEQALEFVANRHEDTSLTRDARDQRFLLEVKNEYGASLFENREKFERILGRAVETDLHGSSQVLDLLELLVGAQGKPVRQVPFQANLLPTYDTASPSQIRESVQSFLSGTSAIHNRSLSSARSHTASTHSSSHRVSHTHHSSSSPGLGLSPTPSSSLMQARTVAPDLPFPLEYPREALTYANASPEILRRYDVRDQRGHLRSIYAIVVNSSALGGYYDVQGTTWTDPPLLGSPGETVRVGSRTYAVYYTGEKARVVAWREGNAAYWVQNTLTDSLTVHQMLAIAETTRPVLGGFSPSAARAVSISSAEFKLPGRATASTNLSTKVGSALAFACLAALALLAWVVLARERQLRALRTQVGEAIALEARQRPVLAAAGIAPATSAPPAPAPAPAPASGAQPPRGAAFAHDGSRTIYRASTSRRTLVVAVTLALALAALALLAVHLLA